MADFGRYQLERKLGQGGMAEVWLARHEALAGAGRQVVIKRVLPQFSEQPDFRKLFVGEARLSMQLSHGNVVQVFDFGEVEGQAFLAMEFVDGLTLHALLKTARRRDLVAVPAPIAAVIGIELCKALQYAHARVDEQGAALHVVHRDISPDNVLISWEGQVKLSDFGIARAVMEGRERTNPDVFRGRLDYCAPEQARGQRVDARSDLYSMGVLLTTLVRGQNPVSARALQIASGAERLAPFPPAVVDETFASIVDLCTATDPSARFQSARELHAALHEWLTERDPSAAVGALPNFLAMLFPDEVRQRGFPVERNQAFVDWVERWTPRPSALATPATIALPVGATRPAQAATPAAGRNASTAQTRSGPTEVRVAGRVPVWALVLAVVVTAVTVASVVNLTNGSAGPSVSTMPTPLRVPAAAMPQPPRVDPAPSVAEPAASVASPPPVAEPAASVASPTSDPEELTDEQAKNVLELARGLGKQGQFGPAIERLNACVRSPTRYRAACYASMGLLYKALAKQSQSAKNIVNARTSLQRALDLASSSDSWVTQVRSEQKALLADERAAEDLVTDARHLAKQQQFESAVIRLEKCTALGPSPTQPDCFKVLGSTLAKIAGRNGSREDMAKARRAYERFLELAAPDDESVPVVRRILEQATRQ